MGASRAGSASCDSIARSPSRDEEKELLETASKILMHSDIIRANWEHVQATIAEAARRSGRDVSSVRLVAVTKRNPPERIRPLVELGQVVLGENYPQELWAKVESLADLPVEWHLIGHLQGNKVKKTLPMVRMIHAVDSLKLLQTLDEYAKEQPSPPKLCLQVNTSGEPSKHGWSPEAILNDSDAIAAITHANVVGLMTIAGYGTSPESARPCFALLRKTRDTLREKTGLALPELSMGMSSDLESAIEEGATFVRVGSSLFEGLDP